MVDIEVKCSAKAKAKPEKLHTEAFFPLGGGAAQIAYVEAY